MARGRAKLIGTGVQTVAVQYSNFEDSFVPDWDRGTAMGQAADHMEPRVKMGNKLTPKLGGVMRPAPGARRV